MLGPANRIALAGAALDLLLSAALTVVLFVAARDEIDAVPRQLVIFGLFAAPGVIPETKFGVFRM